MSQKKSELEVVKFRKIVIIAIAIVLFVFGIKIISQKEVKETIISKTNLNKQNQYESTETSTNTATDSNGITWNYTLDENGNAINVHYETGTLGETVTIPASLDGHAVVELYNSSVSGNIFAKSDWESNTTVKKVIIPEGITSIGYNAFWNCSSLVNINIADTVISIQDFVFYGCSSLTNIAIPEGVTKIGDNVFGKCSSLTSVVIPDTVERIEMDAFQGCSNLRNINIPSSVYIIGAYSFADCSSLTSVEIPSSVIKIGEIPFIGCNSLTSLTVDENNTNYSSENNMLYDKNKTTLIQCVGGKTGEVIIPDSVTSIRWYAFSECSGLTSVVIPEGVTSIGTGAFSKCNNLTIYSNSEYVENYAKENNINYAIYDKISPNLKIYNTQTVWSKEDVVLEIEATDSQSGIARVTVNGETISLNNGIGSYTVTENGTYTVVATDNAENETTETITIDKIDKILPELNISGNPTTWINKDGSLNITAIDSQSGIATVTVNGETIRLNNGIGSYAVTENGTYTVVATDNAENETTETITIDKIDKILPELSISGNPTTWINKDVSLNITAIDSQSGIARVTVNGETISLNNGIGSYTVTENGTYTVVATDNAGNTKTETVEVNNIDKTAPIINSIIKSTEQQEVEMLTLTVNAVDNESGIAEYSWNNGQTWQASNEYEVSKNGTYIVKVKDKVGNISEQSITISNIKETEEPYFTMTNYEITEKDNGKYITGISSESKTEQFKQYIQSNLEYEIVDKKGNTVTDNKEIATGMKIKLSDGSEYILVVKADLNSDGKADISDLGIIASYIVGKGDINTACKLAGDINKDSKVDITDLSILAIAITRNIKL